MKESKLRLVAMSFIAATIFGATLPLASTYAESVSKDVSSGEIHDALASVPGVLATSDQVTTHTDGNSAATVHTNGTVVDVPRDASEGVTFGANSGTKLDIEMPNADEATTAKTVAPGVIGYDSGNGSANAVQPTEDGGVRMLTIIDSPNAPTEYDYKVSVPNGGSVQLTPDGGALVLGSDSQPMTSVSAPWAKDATGRNIDTWFTTNGATLTQHVQHNVPGVVYPVTADPFWSSFVNKAKNAWKKYKGRDIVKCFAGGLAIGIGVMATLIAAPISMGSSTILAIALIGGSAEYVKCRLG